MKRLFLKVILPLIFSISLLTIANASEIGIKHTKGGYNLSLRGEIVQGDLERIRAKIRQQGRLPHRISLISDGGDVDEGLRIGRFIRESLIFTSAFDTKPASARAPCNSTCFLIWVAGVQRASLSMSPGALGMHRPYFDPSYFKGLTPKQAEKKQDAAIAEVKDYLLEMDVRRKVIDEMMAIPSYDIKRLGDDWVLANIGAVSPGFEEWSVANCGAPLRGQEWEDFRAAELVSIYEGTGREPTYALDYYRKGMSFSQGYRDYLTSKHKTTTECWKRIRKDAQQSVYKEMF